MALTLFFIEIFVPSGGVLGVLSVLCAMAGIVVLFKINTTLGLVGAIVCVAAVPVLIMVAIKLWPNTPVGRWISIPDMPSRTMMPSDEEADTDGVPTQQNRSDKHYLVGKTGIAQTDLRPVGVCRIDDRKEPCVAVGGMIVAGTPIKVIAITDDTIKVQERDG
jgi:membrane-bound ClpP family serine protease